MQNSEGKPSKASVGGAMWKGMRRVERVYPPHPRYVAERRVGEGEGQRGGEVKSKGRQGSSRRRGVGGEAPAAWHARALRARLMCGWGHGCGLRD